MPEEDLRAEDESRICCASAGIALLTCCVVLEAILLGLSIFSIVIGVVHLHNCPIQPKIPIYLIGIGILSILPPITGIFYARRHYNIFTHVVNAIIALVFLTWLITGSVWIYQIYQPNFHCSSNRMDLYCNKSLYMFAFCFTTILWVLIAIICVIVPVCPCVLSYCTGH